MKVHLYFQLSFLFVCEFNTFWKVVFNKVFVRGWRWVHIGDWGRSLKKTLLPLLENAVDGCPVCFVISPWGRLNFAWKEFGHSSLFGLSDCYCCWLMAPSQPCLLSAGLSSKTKDVVVRFLFFFLVSRTLLICQTLRPGKFLSTQNASLCRWNLVLSGPCWNTAPQTYYKETLKKRLRASPLTLAHIPFLLPCAGDWKCNIVWQWRLSLSCWSRLNAATHSVPGIWMAGTWTSCIFRSLKPSTEVTFC